MLRMTSAPVLVLFCGTVILFISFGARNIFGLLLDPMTTGLGWSAEEFSFAVALQAFIWGLTTPLTASLADRFGTGRMVALGGLLYAAGMGFMAFASTPMHMNLTAGLMLGLGLSASGFPIILSAVSRRVDERRRALFLSIGSAAGSSGQFILMPVGQYFIDGYGWAIAVIVFAVLAACIVPLAAALADPRQDSAPSAASQQGLGDALREASAHRGFLLLTGGYFVCGFQVMFLATHLPNLLVEAGQSQWVGATSLSLIGLANIIGTLGWGSLGGVLRKKYLLSSIYLLRSIALLLFIVLPVTEFGTYVFSAAIGLLWLATVPLTTGLVAQIFGLRYMATLTGIVFFSHQVGSFFGVWLGGKLFVLTGNYDAIWWISIGLGLLAALVHYPIDDRPVVRPAAQDA